MTANVNTIAGTDGGRAARVRRESRRTICGPRIVTRVRTVRRRRRNDEWKVPVREKTVFNSNGLKNHLALRERLSKNDRRLVHCDKVGRRSLLSFWPFISI